MSDPLLGLPDVERLVVDHLRYRPELINVTVDNRVPPGFDGTTNTVLVSRMGGAWVDDEHLDKPLLELEIYGPDKPTAHVTSIAVREALLQARGTTYGTAFVSDVVETEASRWYPDYNRPAGARYRTIVQLNVRPAPPAA
ncbi:hypothetical protein [Allostreptomyces psammosilenae]|uniref:Uncharacterized protein n=1 Tax=Allostreptomyces psammosilenae TaxID=1892865 RepID=A0A852ZUJ9_9ACTN|nr:hypothetical protein [Allostreptomyces psammosilenae]NYI05247.1 hypothetical protein [Allostreptomyces psammosilenae]